MAIRHLNTHSNICEARGLERVCGFVCAYRTYLDALSHCFFLEYRGPSHTEPETFCDLWKTPRPGHF